MDGGSRADQRIQEADQWAEAHQDLLERCFGHFQAGDGWPTLAILGLHSEAEGGEGKVVEVARSIPPLLGMVEDERLKLNVRGLSKVPGARALLEVWVGVLRAACEDPQRLIGSEMVMAACKAGSVPYGCLAVILMREPWPAPEGQGIIGGRWSVNLSEEVLGVREARTIEDVLRLRGPVESRPFDPFEIGRAL